MRCRDAAFTRALAADDFSAPCRRRAYAAADAATAMLRRQRAMFSLRHAVLLLPLMLRDIMLTP